MTWPSRNLWSVLLLSQSAMAEQPRRVLLIHSFGRDLAPFKVMTSRFRSELAKECPQPVEFVEASLEMARFDGAERTESKPAKETEPLLGTVKKQTTQSYL